MSTDRDASVDEYRSSVAEPDTRSVINASTWVEGTVKSSTDLRVEGQVNGVVECEGVLYVAEGAVIDATVVAGGIIVEGSLSGTILCHGRLEIRASGAVTAEVDTERLVIHEGAVYEGRLRMEVGEQPASANNAEATLDTAPTQESPPSASAYPYLRSFSQSAAGDDTNDREELETDTEGTRE